MNIKLTTDSTCDLPQELLTKNNIHIFPLFICQKDQSYKDLVEINTLDVYKYHDETGELCKTQAVNYDTYYEYFEKETKNYDHIIHISLGSKFSSCYQNAFLAAKEFENIHVIDSNNLSTGQGISVLKAADLINEGKNVNEIISFIEEYKNKIEISFLLSTLEYLQKGGRCSSITAFGASVLRLKPSIDLVDGVMDTGKLYRGDTMMCVPKYVADKLASRDDIDTSRILITDSYCTQEVLDVLYNAVSENSSFDEVILAKSGCTISSHCGPNCLGIIYARK